MRRFPTLPIEPNEDHAPACGYPRERVALTLPVGGALQYSAVLMVYMPMSHDEWAQMQRVLAAMEPGVTASGATR